MIVIQVHNKGEFSIVEDFDSKIRVTILLIILTIVYIAVVSFFLIFLNDKIQNGVQFLFALAIIPILTILLIIWGYGMKFKMPGLELEYYPVEKVMQPAKIINEDTTGSEAEEVMNQEKTDILNIIDKNGIFKGIITKADLLNIRSKNKIETKVKDFMTKRENIIQALEKEDLLSIMRKIGQTKHSRLPVLDNNNRILGIVDSVDINDLLSKLS